MISCSEPGTANKLEIAGDTTPEDLATLAHCLTSDGWVLYSSFTCPACRVQRRLFGDAFGYIQTVECNPNAENAQSERCLEKKIRKTPTWIREQEGTELGRLVGYQSLDALASQSSCEDSF
jgi:hypothetical protein